MTAEDHGAKVAAALLDGDPAAFADGLGLTDPAHWTGFDQAVRRLTTWACLRPSDPRSEARLCHANGRVREAALSGADVPLPLVAIRSADWVPVVRERARTLLARALDTDPAGTLTALTPLVLRLGRREQGAWARERFDAALRTADPALLARLRAGTDLATRRHVARIEIASGRFSVRELAAEAAAERDSATASVWADAALAALACDGPDDTAVDLLLGGRVPMVRASGVTALRGAGRTGEAVRHLTDRSSLVRACARWLARQDGTDPYAVLRPLVGDPARVTPRVVTAFSESAARSDAPLLRPLLAHPEGRVRAAGAAALSRLEVSDLHLMRPLVDDPVPAVAREAAKGLESAARRLDPDWLSARTGPDRPAHTRRAAFRLLRARGGIPAARAAVELARDPDPGIREQARAFLRAWDPRAELFASGAGMAGGARGAGGAGAHPADVTDAEELGRLLRRAGDLFDPYRLGRHLSRLGLAH
ncbi:hypothetical protein AB0P15_31655 [Streptomyces sp. NPDC087917]|uniref:hypothetical protein n=1 Tax=Streptomyces sp. NPDC087917 TaxID=3155060 RepID=UPI00343AA9BE